MVTNGSCPVEKKLGLEAALELDAFLADPKQWPKAIFAGWDLPPGPLPGNFRQWGAVKLGIEWCAEREVKISRIYMERHVAEHVPILPYTPDDIAVRGVEPTAEPHAPVIPTGIRSYSEVYQKGLGVGYRAIELLEERIEQLVEGGGRPPTDLLLKLADLGVKLAQSQASILARGLDLNREKDDEIEGFRTGSAPLPSQRLGHHRIRTIDGEARPVRDEGPGDRWEYNQHAREQGSIELPSP